MDDEYSYAPIDLISCLDGVHYRAAGLVSKFSFPSARNAMYYAMRPQRVNDEGLLVPDARWSPDLN